MNGIALHLVQLINEDEGVPLPHLLIHRRCHQRDMILSYLMKEPAVGKLPPVLLESEDMHHLVIVVAQGVQKGEIVM